MRAGTFTRISNPADNFSPFDFLPRMNLDFEHMAKKRGVSISIMNHNMISITISGIASRFNSSIGCSINGSALGCSEIQSRMKLGGFINGVNAISKT